jgi:phosphogluconate dehydratase
MMLNDKIKQVTDRIRDRSRPYREHYLKVTREHASKDPTRGRLTCTNLAHAIAASTDDEKVILKQAEHTPNIAIVTSYNDMLSAHKPYERYPNIIRDAIGGAGGVCQVAGGTPAMCDGVTQGQPGMELSLYSRDVIAMSTAIALSHDVFDGTLLLGICDKIVPGLLMGALTYGHLPAVFVPAGPMTSGISNSEKSKTRQLFAEGKVGKDALLESESKSYHSEGTCTFYGTANTNQMLMEMMGLHMPGAAFFNPGDAIRDELTRAAARQILTLTAQGDNYTPIADVVDERSVVNGLVGLMATGGSTNHTMHCVAIARAAGIVINWDDLHDISDAVPLLARVYPNGKADVNHFHAAGGMGFVIAQLLEGGYVHADVRTVAGGGLDKYAEEPSYATGALTWSPVSKTSGDDTVVRPVTDPFQPNGGLKVMEGNLGRGVCKVSAVPEGIDVIDAPARVFHDQWDVVKAFEAGELEQDVIVVLRFQGPKAIGMPELHKLTPPLTVLQERGFKVALVTDGRMSGASGKVPAVIHVGPEAAQGGSIARVRDGDRMVINLTTGEFNVMVEAAEFDARELVSIDLDNKLDGYGRELFAAFHNAVSTPEEGATVLPLRR